MDFGHVALKCGKPSKCVKCGGNHRLKDCNSSDVKCINCNGNHTSSFGGCEVYKKNLKDVEDKIRSSSVQTYRQYSQAVKNHSLNDQSINILNEKIDNLNASMNNLEAKISQLIDKKIENFSNECKDRIKKVTESADALKLQQNLAIFDILHAFYPEKKPSNAGINIAVESLAKRNIVVLKTQDVINYIDQLYIKKPSLTTSNSSNNLSVSSRIPKPTNDQY